MAWDLVTNSPYLLVPNPFYNNGSGFNINIPYPSQANPLDRSEPSNLNANHPERSGLNLTGQPSNLNAGGSRNVFDALWEEMLGSPPTIVENTLMPQNPLMENVENPPIVEGVGNIGVEENQNVGMATLLLENPPILEEGENVGNVDGNEKSPIFNPNDKQLVIEFLAKRLRNEPLEVNSIQEINFYDHTPQYISENYIHAEPGTLYFFTPVRRLSDRHAVRSVPGAGGGKWARVGGFVQHVKDTNDNVFNVKSFRFVPNDSNLVVSWLMKEYSLSSEERPPPGSSNMHECVLVKLYQ